MGPKSFKPHLPACSNTSLSGFAASCALPRSSISACSAVAIFRVGDSHILLPLHSPWRQPTPKHWNSFNNDAAKLWKTELHKVARISPPPPPPCGAAIQRRPWPRHSWGSWDHTQGRNAVGGTPLGGWSARRRDFYLTTNNSDKRQTSIPPERIRTRNPSKRAAADPRVRPCGHWNQQLHVQMECTYFTDCGSCKPCKNFFIRRWREFSSKSALSIKARVSMGRKFRTLTPSFHYATLR